MIRYRKGAASYIQRVVVNGSSFGYEWSPQLDATTEAERENCCCVYQVEWLCCMCIAKAVFHTECCCRTRILPCGGRSCHFAQDGMLRCVTNYIPCFMNRKCWRHWICRLPKNVTKCWHLIKKRLTVLKQPEWYCDYLCPNKYSQRLVYRIDSLTSFTNTTTKSIFCSIR